MTSQDFVYWLQGYFELAAASESSDLELTPKQLLVVKKHLAMVFKHEIDPAMGDEKHQAALNVIHNDGRPGGPVFRC
jgi:hypothetical protein